MSSFMLRRCSSIALAVALLASVPVAAYATGTPPPPPPDGTGQQRPPRPDGQSGQTGGQQGQTGGQAGTGYTVSQAISDKAQLTTIAFDGLGFLTGSLGSDSFFPPGKVADFWGFQYLRDNDPSGMGHNTDFLTKAALNMLNVLTDDQRSQLIALAKSQVDDINAYGYKRFVLMGAFRRLLSGELPSGTSGLSRPAVLAYSQELYQLDGQISYQRASVMGPILAALTTEQKATLATMVGKGMSTWPDASEPAALRALSHDEKVAVMTYAGDLFSWYAGNVAADVYFCPERHGTYFGSFYLKDAPAVGNAGYSISTSITGDMGSAFLQALDATQRAKVTGIVSAQKDDLAGIVKVREQVATLLRQFRSGGQPSRTDVMAAMAKYGALDGSLNYRYASTFAAVSATLTSEQRAALQALRVKTVGTLTPTGAYLFSTPIDMPTIPSTDFLFS